MTIKKILLSAAAFVVVDQLATGQLNRIRCNRNFRIVQKQTELIAYLCSRLDEAGVEMTDFDNLVLDDLKI